MESFVQKFLPSELEDVNEVLLERRISPYVTLRPGDLEALLRHYNTLPLSQKLLGRIQSNASHARPRIDTIFEKRPLYRQNSGDSEDDKSDGSEDLQEEVVCRGEEMGHVPVEYRVCGLRKHELPVIGVYVDKRINPGFQYQVRKLGSDSFLWAEKAKTLVSVGMGYGCRLTFTGDHFSDTSYFWSDSEPSGFGFSIQAVEVNQKFIIQDCSDNEVGEAVINKICAPQVETSMTAGKDGVTKHVSVALTCHVTYYQRMHHGLRELVSPKNTEVLTGEAILIKPRLCKRANLLSIEKVFLPRIGRCKLIPDN